MSLDRCMSFAREFGIPEPKARELCQNQNLQRCATFWRPETEKDLSFDNLAGCYDAPPETERKD